MLEKYDHIAYPDDLFYKVHKISIKDFLEKLESAQDKQSVLLSLFDDESHKTGRRGVSDLKKSVLLVKKKIRNKEKMVKFAKKFTEEGLSHQEIRSTGFMRSDMLY